MRLSSCARIPKRRRSRTSQGNNPISIGHSDLIAEWILWQRPAIVGYEGFSLNSVKGKPVEEKKPSSYDEARRYFDDALRLHREVGDKLGEANAILNLGELALRLLSYDDAQTRFAEALPLYRQVADPRPLFR